MYRQVTASLIVLALVPSAVSEALAQDRLDLSSALEINVHGGAAFLDALETNELFGGATALLHVGSGIALGGTVDWVGTTIDPDEEDEEGALDATLWYYSAELSYAFPSVTQAQFYGLIGAGVARFQPGSDLEDAGAEDETDPMVPVGVGVRGSPQGRSFVGRERGEPRRMSIPSKRPTPKSARLSISSGFAPLLATRPGPPEPLSRVRVRRCRGKPNGVEMRDWRFALRWLSDGVRGAGTARRRAATPPLRFTSCRPFFPINSRTMTPSRCSAGGSSQLLSGVASGKLRWVPGTRRYGAEDINSYLLYARGRIHFPPETTRLRGAGSAPRRRVPDAPENVET